MTATSEPGERNHGGLLASGFLTLVASAYFDSMKGPLLPVIARELALPYGRASWFLTSANIGALFVSIFLNRVLNRYGEKKAFVVITVFAAATSLVSLVVTSFGTLLLFGAMLGAVVALLGTMCSILILQGGAARIRGNIYSASQVLVGLSFLAFPLLLEAALRRAVPWHGLVAPAVGYFLAVGLLALRAIPTPEPHVGTVEEMPPITRAHWLLIFVFGLYVAGEAMGFVWLLSYARDALHKNDADATAMLVHFFMWFAGSRLVVSLGIRPRWEVPTIFACLALGTVAAIAGLCGYTPAFPAMGVIGPFFPLMLTYTSRMFPSDWRRMTVWVFLYIQIFMALTHLLVGYLAESFGLGLTYWLMPVFFLMTIFVFIIFQRHPK